MRDKSVLVEYFGDYHLIKILGRLFLSMVKELIRMNKIITKLETDKYYQKTTNYNLKNIINLFNLIFKWNS